MKRYVFYGASDDLIEVEGDFTEEYGCYGKTVTFVVGGIAQVRSIYDGCWSFAVGQIEEDVLIPDDWTISVRQRNGHAYSTELVIETPNKLTIVRTHAYSTELVIETPNKLIVRTKTAKDDDDD